MAVVTVTVTGVAVTATSTSSATATLSTGTVAGIIIGTLLGGILFMVLVLYLLHRCSQHKFTRVANPGQDGPNVPDLRHLPSSRRPRPLSRHSKKASISNEPLMSPASWPAMPSTSRVRSPLHSDSVSPGMGESQDSPFDLREIGQVVASRTLSHSTPLATLSIPPARKPDEFSLRSGLGDTPPRSRQPSGDDAPTPPTPPKPRSTLFLHRILQSRAQASEALSYRSSFDFPLSPSTTHDSETIRPDEERLLAEAERTALRDAENARREEEEDRWEVESIESIYSQISAPLDHSAFLSDRVSTLPRRKSSRKQARTRIELSPVAEMPDTPRAHGSLSQSSRISAAGNSSLDGQVSHVTTSHPTSSVINQPGTFPLLTSANFGKSSTTSGSVSSTVGRGSGSSSGPSRYPSLAPSSVLPTPQSGPRSETETDWHNTPPGLSALTSLDIGPLENPHSPVEAQSDASRVLGPVPAKHARLREGTVSSIPEVERRNVMQGGIARIDVAF